MFKFYAPTSTPCLTAIWPCGSKRTSASLVGLLREDAWFTMPPLPIWFQGRVAIATRLATRILIPGRYWHLLPTRANGSPACGLYRWEAGADIYQLFGLVVLGVVGEQIGSLVAFLELSSLSSFALPPTFLREPVPRARDSDFTGS